MLCKFVKNYLTCTAQETLKLEPGSELIWIVKFHCWNEDTKSFLELVFVKENKNFFKYEIVKLTEKSSNKMNNLLRTKNAVYFLTSV